MKVSYCKEIRERAKNEGKGLITIDYIQPDGGRCTTQMVAPGKLVKRVSSFLNRLLGDRRALSDD